uniref:Cytochrome n=1 Tax=Lutzomyia longipalpis TaxID=7200 RepID=A0A1B0CGD6_LUTLO
MLSCLVNYLVSFVFSKWSVVTAILGYLAYKWGTSNYDTFEKRGVKFIPPLPFLGNFKDLVFQTKSLLDLTHELYRYFPNEKLLGTYEFRTPDFMIRDPLLIKQLGVKDFDYFLDHRIDLREDVEPLFGRNLFSLKGQRWREMRSTLSPAFTGSKMRQMFQLVSECCNDTVNYLEKEAKDGKPILTDMKDLFTRFTNDLIATSAFGLKVDSLNDRENEFYTFGKSVTDIGALRGFCFFLAIHFPNLSKALGISLFPKKFRDFFRNLVWDTIRRREKENIIRPDMINLLIQARRRQLGHEKEEVDKEGYAVVQETRIGEAIHESKLVEDDLTAQCLIFFFAGFDTASTCMCFTAHELAVNPDVQMKLIEEVDAMKEQLGGKALTYEALQNMIYLDMVISESLRYWPPAVATDRKCVKPYRIKVDDIDCEVKVGEGIIFPIVSLHHDPQYFPDPSRFDPERFSEERIRMKLNHSRSRFALMETKAIIYYILTKFTFEISEKTQIPLKMGKSVFTAKPEKGFWLNLKPRNTLLIGFVFSKWGAAVAALVYVAYKWSISPFDTWEKRGVKSIPPVPFFGNFKEVLLQTKTFNDATNEQYNYFPNEQVFGIYQLRQPLLMIRDPEIIKQVGVKDFDHFLDHRVNMDEDHEPLFGRNLFSLKGQRWRDMRATLSPAFTGSKMRTMFQLVSDCCNDALKYLDKEANNGRPVQVELKDFFTRVTNDVIATCAFGIKLIPSIIGTMNFTSSGKKATDFYWTTQPHLLPFGSIP